MAGRRGRAAAALGSLRHLGGGRGGPASRRVVQVRDPHRLGRARRSRGPLRVLRGNRAFERIARVAPRLRLERRRLDARAPPRQRDGRALLGLRAAPRLVAAPEREPADLSRDRDGACRLCAGDGLHARGADADHRASVLRLVGLPDHGLLRAHLALRLAAGLHVHDRRAAPARHRRHPRLGAVAFSGRSARAREVRRHASLRARRSAPGLPPRVEERDLQLRAPRGARLPHVERAFLAGEVPHRRAARGRGRLDALPRLRAQGRRVDAWASR